MSVSGGRLRRIFKKGAVCLCALVLALIVIPVFVVDSFIVDGDSMLPTLSDGKRVYVNKLLMGARIYTKYDFDSPELGCFRRVCKALPWMSRGHCKCYGRILYKQ